MRGQASAIVLAVISAVSFFAAANAKEVDRPAPGGLPTPFGEDIDEGEPAFSLAHIVDEPELRSAALLDRDRDGYADIIFAAPGSATLVDNLGAGTFSTVGSISSYSGTGFGAHDFNQDGVLDLHLSLADYDDAMIVEADGKLTFTNIGTEVEMAVVRTALFEDFDGDGNVDGLLTTSFFRSKHQWPLFFHGLDGEGFSGNMIDSFLSPPSSEFWYRKTPHVMPENEEECADELWAVKQFKGGIVRDFDLDGRPDIVSTVYADTGFRDERCSRFSWAWADAMERGLFFFHNIGEPGHPAFEEIGLEVFGAFAHGNTREFWNPYQATPLDYDRDGDLDLFVGAFLRPLDGGREDTVAVRFLENYGGHFIDRTAEAGFDWLNQLDPVVRAERTFAAGAPVDYDNDGWVDLILVNRADWDSRFRRVHVFKNDGRGAFDFVHPDVHGMWHGSGRDLTYGDLNLDGFVDVVVADGVGGGTQGDDDAKIYFNTLSGNGNNWIAVHVLTPGGTAAIGSKVSLYDSETDELLGYKEVRTDFSYRSKKLPVLYFGLGPTSEVDIAITPRLGDAVECKNLAVNRYWDLSLLSTTPIEDSRDLDMPLELQERGAVASESRFNPRGGRKLCKKSRSHQ